MHAVGDVGLGVDLPGAAELVVVVDVESAQIDLKRVENVAQRNAQHLALGPVDIDVHLRRIGAENGRQPCRPVLASVPF